MAFLTYTSYIHTLLQSFKQEPSNWSFVAATMMVSSPKTRSMILTTYWCIRSKGVLWVVHNTHRATARTFVYLSVAKNTWGRGSTFTIITKPNAQNHMYVQPQGFSECSAGFRVNDPRTREGIAPLRARGHRASCSTCQRSRKRTCPDRVPPLAKRLVRAPGELGALAGC